MQNIDINIDSIHAVDIAWIWLLAKLLPFLFFVILAVPAFFVLRYLSRKGQGIVLPKVPVPGEGDRQGR